MSGVGPHPKTVDLLNFLHTLAAVALLSAPLLAGSARAAPPNFIEFESGHVRPIAMSPSKTQLFAVNTPNATLEIFNVTPQGLVFQARVPVGLEPVAVAARNNGEVWVVNHLSDSVSVVTLVGIPHVVRTLLVGDEPRDIVFAGSTGRAFITTAHRGQQRTDPSIAGVEGAGDPQMTTSSVPRADVWVFDPDHLGTTLGGTPVRIMTFFTDTPRALAVSPDGNTVFVAGFKTGNQTSIVNEGRICTGFNTNQPCWLSDLSISPGGHLGPATDASGEPAPEVGMIVKYNNAHRHWEDELGRNWDNSIRFSLPDTDVFAVDANSLSQTASFAHIGTTLFNMVVNPASGHLYVSNTEAVNNVRFEGPGTFAGHTVQGHLAEARVTVISGATVTPRHLNKHINYAKLAGSSGFDPTAKDHSLATPLDMAVTRDGTTLYVAAFGSSKIGVFNTTELENDTFDPTVDSANYIPVSGGGPSGIVLDEPRQRLYVMTRFDDAVKVIDLATKQQIAALPLPNPESASVVQGRPMLYDATRFSGNGEASCSSCHIFGDNDDLSWDLGNPDATVTKNPTPINESNPLILAVGETMFGVKTPLNGSGKVDDFHPMKGPMTTQTLRGLTNSGAMHWRGDRSNGFFGIDPFNENLSFNNFIVAFQGLVGSVDQPSAAQMQGFTDFQLQVVPPPNPVRSLDNSLTASQQRGHDFYFGPHPSDGFNVPGIGLILGTTTFTCNGCHALDPSQGKFGASKNDSFEGIEQVFKIPHLRNLYTKVGMFGMPAIPGDNPGNNVNQGAQIRGSGFQHDGTVDTLFRFLQAQVFNPRSRVGFAGGDPQRRDVEQFLLAFDTDLAPIVGQQVTLDASNAAMVGPRIDLLIARARTLFASQVLGPGATECDLVARGVVGGHAVTFALRGGMFTPDDGGPAVSDAALRALAAVDGQQITYTCLPPGWPH